MKRNEFISLIGTQTIFDYPFGKENQIWSIENFLYDEKSDVVYHDRLPLIIDNFILNAGNPRFGTIRDTTHGGKL